MTTCCDDLLQLANRHVAHMCFSVLVGLPIYALLGMHNDMSSR